MGNQMTDIPEEMAEEFDIAERAFAAFDQLTPGLARSAAVGACVSMLIELLPLVDQRAVLEKLQSEIRRRVLQ